MTLYLTIKSLHIIFIISWMCGLLYMPRLFVYHCVAKQKSESDKMLQIMERKLLRIIMNPAMILSFVSGMALIHTIGFSGGWLHIKLLLVLILAGFHGFLSKCRKDFEKGQNKYSEKFYRFINEIPTIIMIAIIFLVIFQPL